jgi:murein DD-endopeptidase MepM/ murein hydrolase activator NlpD
MPNRTFIIASLLLAGIVVGCMPSTPYPATPTKTPNPAATPATPIPSSTPGSEPTQPLPTADPPTPVEPEQTPASETQSAAPAVSSTSTITAVPPTRDASLPAEHYLLLRPIPSDYTDYPDRTYAYGATSGGQYRPHTGEEFRNSLGTPVIAAGNATVHYAGTDETVVYGPQPGFYGNLVVLQMTDFTYNGQPVYALYGHLGEIDVQTGQTVAMREVIGTVGASGVALGPHLHFEVRVGDPLAYFSSTRNPDLWIRPYPGYGTLAGRVIDSHGIPLREVALTVHGVDMTRYTWTYAGDENIPDAQWKENFALGDLPEGWYTVTTRSGPRTYSADVYIANGYTTWLEFAFD